MGQSTFAIIQHMSETFVKFHFISLRATLLILSLFMKANVKVIICVYVMCFFHIWCSLAIFRLWWKFTAVWSMRNTSVCVDTLQWQKASYTLCACVHTEINLIKLIKSHVFHMERVFVRILSHIVHTGFTAGGKYNNIDNCIYINHAIGKCNRVRVQFYGKDDPQVTMENELGTKYIVHVS